METLKLNWLGAPLVEWKGRAIKLETRKATALLAYLSLNPGECRRERLAAMFWPEANQQKALANLRRTLSSLNSSVVGWIEADRETITLKRNDRLWVDVDAFHQLFSQLKDHHHPQNEVCENCLSVLGKAIELYRSDFLEGLNLSDSPGFDEWQFFQRDGLRQEFAKALDCLSRGYAELKQWEPAIRCARRWVALDRLHEPACRRLMDLYARSGQRTAALHQYEELARLLHEQMSQEPEQETHHLYEQIYGREGATSIHESADRLTTFPLLKTKLYIPTAPASRVIRSHLIDCLDEVAQKTLTLISAPAGFGKTTLLAEWLTRTSLPVAWLSLDKYDNQTGRFLNYMVAALQEADDRIGREATQLLAGMQQVHSETILTSLINDIDSVHAEIVLVLDDYQFIDSQAVHEEVAFLLEHCPNTFHLVIATRSDPPLPFARLRARGQTVELRAADLSFTEPEAAQFLNDVMGLYLDAGSVVMLRERTEGWIVGLQMAALSMRHREDIPRFMEAFSGTNRYILDYLLEEVLASQSVEIQRFLLCTSILERLTAPLCDAVISASLSAGLANDGGSKAEVEDRLTGSESRYLSGSASILDYLERANLFLVPLDDERHWYRYHHLFADLLRARLDLVLPGLSPQLHTRAAAWLEQAEMTVEAINHTLLAGEYDHAARLVEENTTRLLAQGELNALIGWMEILPEELRLARPWLCVHQAYALIFAGRSVEVGPLLAQAEASLQVAFVQGTASPNSQAGKTDALSMDMAEAHALKGAIAAIRAFTAAIAQDAKALSQVQQARGLLAAGDLFNQCLVAWALGYAWHSQGNLAEARSAFEEQIRLGRALQNEAILMIGLTALARVLADQGSLSQARVLMEEALAEARQKGFRNLAFIARTEAHLAGVLYQQNELEAAHDLLSDALSHARFWLNPNHVAFIYSYLAHMLLAKGDLSGARNMISEADQIRRKAQLSPWIRSSLEVEIVKISLALQSGGMHLAPSDPLVEQSNLILASWRRELAGRTESQDVLLDQRAETIFLSLARVSLASGRIDEALALLEPVVRSARAAGHNGIAIDSLILTAIASQNRPAARIAPAFKALEEALTLGEPSGYVRLFLNEGQPLRMLLAQWLAHAGTNPLSDYAVRLLSQFDAMPYEATAASEKDSSAGHLVDPLSPREFEVLHLLALGRTNEEIAGQLVVSRGTIKAHTASIYRKLEAANRTEAVSRARQLGILP